MKRTDTRLLTPFLLAALVSCDGASRPGGAHAGGGDSVGTETVVLEVPQYLTNHNGGSLFFDDDGYLYLGLGDGGGAGDNENNAQDRTNLLGSIIRIAVDPDADSEPFYTIPPDNPFVGNASGFREEIFAYGLRNPWRVSFDEMTGTIWAGDVGQNTYEEIDVIESGKNYGWDCREGMHAYTGPPDAPSPLCQTVTGLVDPVYEYTHALGNSITGGYVYRGAAVPALYGRYVYADYGTGRVWALTTDGSAVNSDVVDAPFPISSFGVDTNGELYVLRYSTSGKAYRIEGDGGGGFQLVDAFPALTFVRPVDMRSTSDGRAFVVEQDGRVIAFDTADPDSSWTLFSMTDRVQCCGEQGLLGLALHPDFDANGIVYVYYTPSFGANIGRISRIKAE